MSDYIMNQTNVTAGDIVQITDEKHPWYPALLIVDEVRNWGVIAYIIIPKSNDGTEPAPVAYNRLPYNQIARVGEATIA